MASHAPPRRQSHSRSPPSSPEQDRPVIQVASSIPNSNPVKSVQANSPVRRKPLPPNAFSPQTPSDTSPQYTRQQLEPTSVPSPPTRARNLEFALQSYLQGVQYPPPGVEVLRYRNLHSRQNSKQNSLSRSSTNGSHRGFSSDDLPDHTGRNSRPNRSNGALQESAIIEEDMGLKTAARPAPLRTESNSSSRSLSANDPKKPQTPGGKFTSFFSRKQVASPSVESPVTEISDQARSPYPISPSASNYSGRSSSIPNGHHGPVSQQSQDSIDFDVDSYRQPAESNVLTNRCAQLEAELRDISAELAGSIKREMDLEDMVERLQSESSSITVTSDRTSDYFSDSGTSSIRPRNSEYNLKEELEKVKRDAEQQKAQLRVELSQKWQEEVNLRTALESQLLKVSQSRQSLKVSSPGRTKELELALEDSKRRLNEEKKTKENFEDLLNALRGDLNEHRIQRDRLRDQVIPQMKARIESLEMTITETEKSTGDLPRMQAELQSLRDENQAFHSARMMNAQFGPTPGEEETPTSPRNSFFSPKGAQQRTPTIPASKSGLNRSNSIISRPHNDSPQALSDQIKAVEAQRDALHSTVKYLLRRQGHQTKQFEKQLQIAKAERERPTSVTSLNGARKGGYEREVRSLRSEINLLRKRADDALEQKWQCEKGLAGLKMDLDRSKQETENLQHLLQARDNSAPEVLSSTLEQALMQLQQQREQVTSHESLGLLQNEQDLSDQLEKSAERSEALSVQVKQQLQSNSTLRNRLMEAINKGERDQHASAQQINELQNKLRKLEDVITSAQVQSETAVMKHEEEIRVLRASHNAHLLRVKTGGLPSNLFSPTPRSPLSPLFSNNGKSPRLDKTSTGPGMPLHQALKTEFLERKVAELEAALSEAEKEMGEVVGRMNTAQIGVAELEAERDEALRMTRKLEAAIADERVKVQGLVTSQ